MKKPGSEKRSFKPAIASKGNSDLVPELADDVTDKPEADKNAGSLGGSNDSSTSAQFQSKTSAGKSLSFIEATPVDISSQVLGAFRCKWRTQMSVIVDVLPTLAMTPTVRFATSRCCTYWKMSEPFYGERQTH